jgi:predicted HTH transcriptional regulator
MILKHLKENKKVQINKIKEITQLGTLEAKNVLKELINKRLIELSGRDYMLTQIAYEKMGDSIGYTKDKSIDHIRATDMIKEYIKDNGYITKSIIMDLFSFTEDKAKYIIRKLTEKEIILKEGSGKATKYIIKEN